MNRNLGRLLAVIFGLTLFFEVACLPLISACALQVEKTIVAELDELDEKEAEKGFDFLQLFSPVEFFGLHLHSADGDQFAEIPLQNDVVIAPVPTFLAHCSIRI